LDNQRLWPSILAADLLNLAQDLHTLTAHNIWQIHLDVMDNHYVPNLTFGPDMCAKIREKFPQMQIDVHLMTSPVDNLILNFAQNGANRIAIHTDSTANLPESLALIQANGCQAGIAINPHENLELDYPIDYILAMTVNPGFGGQKLKPEVLKKINTIKQQYPNTPIMADGGINLSNLPELIACGINDFVIGTALFAHDFPNCINDYLRILDNAN